MTYKMLLTSTAILLVSTTSAFAQDCASLRDAYATSGGDISSDVTLTNPDRTIECEFEDGVLVSEEITRADGTET